MQAFAFLLHLLSAKGLSARNRLGEEHVDVLIKISLGPATEVFDFRTAVQHWKAAKQRRLHFSYRPHKIQGFRNSKMKRKATRPNAVAGTVRKKRKKH